MPKQITTAVFEYDELSNVAKARAREWFLWSSEGDNFWSEGVIEDATRIAALLGITIKDILWSGFCSQGDGACFVGSWSASDVKPSARILSEYPEDKELQRLAKAFEDIAKEYPEGSYATRHAGRYYHSHSVDFDFHMPTEADDEKLSKDELWLIEISRDFMIWVYSSLEAQYRYETSDEVVGENIKANEYTFTADGKRFCELS